MKETRLIVNADDLGMSIPITDGIFRAHLEGIVTSASLMVNQPGSEYALQQLRYFPSLGVGVHLNICTGAPILPPSKVRSLVTAAGEFHGPAEMVRRLLTWRVFPREIEAEFRAQIRWMNQRDLSPTHADSHHHLNTYPCAVGAFSKALRAEGIHRARATRHRHWPRNGFLGGSHGGSVYRRLLVTGYMEFLQSLVFREFNSPDSCVVPPPQYRTDCKLLGEGWRLTVTNLPSGTYELACHPGLTSGQGSADRFNVRREIELGFLTDPEFRAIVSKRNIRLINYREL